MWSIFSKSFKVQFIFKNRKIYLLFLCTFLLFNSKKETFLSEAFLNFQDIEQNISRFPDLQEFILQKISVLKSNYKRYKELF